MTPLARAALLVVLLVCLAQPLASASHAYTHAYVLEGRVMTPTGPLQRAPIEVVIAGGETVLPAIVQTDCRGDYHFQYHLHELAEGITLTARHGNVSSETVPLDLELRRTTLDLQVPEGAADPACAGLPSWETTFTVHGRVLREVPPSLVDGVMSRYRQELDTPVTLALERDGERIATMQAAPGRYGDFIADLPVADVRGAELIVETRETRQVFEADAATRRADLVITLPERPEHPPAKLALLVGAPLALAAVAFALWRAPDRLRAVGRLTSARALVAIALVALATTAGVAAAAWAPQEGGGRLIFSVAGDADGISGRDVHTMRLLTLSAVRDAEVEDIDLDAAPFLMAPLALDAARPSGTEVLRLYGVNTRSTDVVAFGSDFYWFPAEVSVGRHVYAFGNDADVVVLGAAAQRALFPGAAVGDEVTIEVPAGAGSGLKGDAATIRARVVGILAPTTAGVDGPDNGVFMPAGAFARHLGRFDAAGPAYTHVGISVSPVPPEVLGRADGIADLLSGAVGGAPVTARVLYDAPPPPDPLRAAVLVAASVLAVAAVAVVSALVVAARRPTPAALLQAEAWGIRRLDARFATRAVATLASGGAAIGLALAGALVFASAPLARSLQARPGVAVPTFEGVERAYALVALAILGLAALCVALTLAHGDRRGLARVLAEADA